MKGRISIRGKGQALVLFLGFAAAMIGILLVSFNSGQVTNAKMRAMNAADAAAYSGAVWQARSLNFQAYMNRAIVVNEVTIAQSVSLRSWVEYLTRFIDNINLVGQFIPYLNVVTRTLDKGMEAVDKAVDKALPRFEDAARTLTYYEHQAQKAFHAGGVAGATDIATDVAKKNGAEISAGGIALIARNQQQWEAFTETYSRSKAPAGAKGDGRARLRAVVLDSRDGFTQNRKWEKGFELVAEGKLNKQGGTDLINYDAWKGLDSVAFCTGILKCRPWTPVGWGGAQAYTPNKATAIGTHGSGNWNRSDGKLAKPRANSNEQANKLRFAFSDYRDLQDLDPKNTAKQKIPFAIEVLVADKDVPTARSSMGARTALTDGTAIEHDPHYAGSGVYGLAEACVSFERPVGEERADKRIERPSLFNPYWRASLATPGKDTRGIAGAAKKLVPIEVFAGGHGSCS